MGGLEKPMVDCCAEVLVDGLAVMDEYGIAELCRRSKPISDLFWISFVMAEPHI